MLEARRITNFEGKRRQMQFVGKAHAQARTGAVQAVRDALDEQRSGSAWRSWPCTRPSSGATA